MKIIAKYGIDIHELRIRYDRDRNEVQVANVKPKFLSFNDFDYEWKIAEVMEYKISLGGYWPLAQVGRTGRAGGANERRVTG